MKYFICSIFLSIATLVSGQIGVSVQYHSNNFNTWNNFVEDQSNVRPEFFSTGLQAGVNYWFRLKEKRIEFLPELIFGIHSSDNLEAIDPLSSADMRVIGFNFNVQIYPLDFFNDCNCPTFSNQGTFFSKGFYWLISPGAFYTMKSVEYFENGNEEPSDLDTKNLIIPHIGIGAGLDIGIAEIFTISPFVLYDFQFGHDFEELPAVFGINGGPETDLSSNISRLSFGLRFMFRPDYER